MPKKKQQSPKKSVAPPLRPSDFKVQPKPVVEPEPPEDSSPPTDPLTDLLTRVGLAVAWLDHHGLTNTDCWFILKKIQKDYGEEKE